MGNLRVHTRVHTSAEVGRLAQAGCMVLLLAVSGCLKAPEQTVSKNKKKPAEPKFEQTFEPTAEEIARGFGHLGGKIVRNSGGSVRYVVLTDLPVGDDALESIDKLEDVEVLGLNGTQVTDYGMQKLQGLKRLTYLFLNDTAVSDQGLLSLAENPSLRFISMDNTNLSARAVKEFHRLSPGTLVQHSQRQPGMEDLYPNPNQSTLATRPSAEDFLKNNLHGVDSTGGAAAQSGADAKGNVVLRYREDKDPESSP